MTMKTANAAVKIDTNNTETTAERDALFLIKPSHCSVNSAGQHWKEMLVHCPKNMVADDLRSPQIWKLVQQTPQSALCTMDRLFVVGFLQDWYADCLVKCATANEAKLVILRVGSFAEISDQLFSDGVLQVWFDGQSFGVRRVNDKVPIASGFSTEGQAIDALKSSYPRTVGR